MKHKTPAFAVSQLGIIGLPTVCYTREQARKQAVESERSYMEEDGRGFQTDQQIWRRLYRQGFRVVRVSILHDDLQAKE